MSNTLQDLIISVRRIIGSEISNKLSDQDMTDYINEVLRDDLPMDLIPDELCSNFRLTLASGIGEYGLDPSMLALLAPVLVDNAKAMLTFDREWFFGKFASRYDLPFGHPSIVLLFNDSLWLYPVPDGTYTITATALAKPDELKDRSDSTPNASWGSYIAYMTAYRIAMINGAAEPAKCDAEMANQALVRLRRKRLFEYNSQRSVPNL